MRITLAYRYLGHPPGAILTVDEATARLLIREGRARLAPPVKKSKPTPKRTHKPRTVISTPADTGQEQEAE